LRVTCDYDGTGFIAKYKTTYAWLWLKVISRGMQYGRKSASKGYHVKCHFLKIPFWVSLLIRFLLFEDVHRSLFDLQRLKKPKQILWTHKEKRPAGCWGRSLLEVIR